MFPRFKKRLPGNPVKQKLVIQSIVLVRNFRTEIVGLNQIRTVFDPEYERCRNPFVPRLRSLREDSGQSNGILLTDEIRIK